MLPLPLKVAELFAGVGGFRLGLEYDKKSDFQCVWSNQWEPGTKVQHASRLYVERFGAAGHCNKDISTIDVKGEIPDHDVLVGGFPCQDYSVARTLNQASGLTGKKGVLWWQIHRILSEKGARRPAFLFLENVDRLLKSPASQRGRDFAVMLASLADLGYSVEWRVINAAEYGFPQRRRRVFLVGYHSSLGDLGLRDNQFGWILKEGPMAQAFAVEPRTPELPIEQTLEGDLAALSKDFNCGLGRPTPFMDCGVMVGRKFWTLKTKAVYTGRTKTLGDVLQPEREVPADCRLNPAQLADWRWLKGAKKDPRVDKKTGHKYFYSEGPIAFPDPTDRPSRTVVTGEGGSSPSRFKHVVMVNGYMRRLTPVELERLNMFPDDHTAGIPDSRRAFLMGNALVVGVVRKIGEKLAQLVKLRQATASSVPAPSPRERVSA